MTDRCDDDSIGEQPQPQRFAHFGQLLEQPVVQVGQLPRQRPTQVGQLPRQQVTQVGQLLQPLSQASTPTEDD